MGLREVLSRSVFVILFCSKSGFKSTGIYPVNHTKKPVERLDPQLLKWYNHSLKNRKPEKIIEELVKMLTKDCPVEETVEQTPADNSIPTSVH